MQIAVQEIFKKALCLNSMDRAKLIEALFSSFDIEKQNHVDTLWAKEAESRIEAYDSSKISAASAEDVFDRMSRR